MESYTYIMMDYIPTTTYKIDVATKGVYRIPKLIQYIYTQLFYNQEPNNPLWQRQSVMLEKLYMHIKKLKDCSRKVVIKKFYFSNMAALTTFQKSGCNLDRCFIIYVCVCLCVCLCVCVCMYIYRYTYIHL